MVASKGRVRLCIALIVCNIAFIWINSLMPAQISAAFSAVVNKVLGLFFTGEGGAQAMGTGLLRKIAHVLEFTCLGILFTWYVLMGRRKPVLSLLPGLCVACVDETIQCFVPGRGPKVTDVAIDMLGVSLGIGIMVLLQFIISKFRRNKP